MPALFDSAQIQQTNKIPFKGQIGEYAPHAVHARAPDTVAHRGFLQLETIIIFTARGCPPWMRYLRRGAKSTAESQYPRRPGESKAPATAKSHGPEP